MKRPAPRAQLRPVYAQIVSREFRRISNTMGEWRGVVRGNGTVHLALKIRRAGSVDSRYIGHVTLANKSTWFNFRSPLPRERDWEWELVADAM